MGVTLRHRAYTSVVVCTQARCLALESHGAELKGALAEATARMERFRKSYKDTGTLRLPANCVVSLLLLDSYTVRAKRRSKLLITHVFDATNHRRRAPQALDLGGLLHTVTCTSLLPPAASEAQAQKSDVAAKEEECARLRRQLDKTESALRNVSSIC
jgi:hypothetical protein